MRKLTVLITILSTVFFCTQFAFAIDIEAQGWELYDNFNSGIIDPNKWWVDDDSAIITIENGKAKFVYTGPANESSYLGINDCPETIIGISVEMTIPSCDTSEDYSGRIAMHPGTIDGYYAWAGLQHRPGKPRINASLAVLDQNDDYEWIRDEQYCNFRNPIDLIGKTIRSTMVYTNKEMYYVVQGLGRQVFTMPQPFSAPIELFKAIGMKGYDIVNPGGGCTIIFDNVYVLRNGAPCD